MQWEPLEAKMATIPKRMLSFFVRSSALTIRQSLPARHNPGLKRKKGPIVDKKKKKQVFIRKPTEIVPPIDPESLLNPALLKAPRLRKPIELPPEEQERRTLLLKEWSRFKMKQHKEELQRVQELERCREEALKELKKTSVFLYHEAIKVDRDFFPLEFNGPTETPPKADYLAPDMEENKVKVKARR
ncbi:PREDICTED: 39S ribosomal protein L40, mitochondrial-like [Acropora digitifera]|uniref:39S ribosomal protein L40, mitochondrial-like n=1 Tax=Acropora digitifera TaxID=70779 RepID=UPI00077AF94C|nr:PREDICTED: 39S ribosomal protein L40, mitochondrial-like [Acropora digitifera]